MTPQVLDLFSGVGGLALGFDRAGMETRAFCEKNPECRAWLRAHWPNTPIHEDIYELDGNLYKGIDVITGGFPCQPYSNAGKQLGTDDDRDLWPEMRRVISEAKSTWVCGENVAGFVRMELERTIADLESLGYSVQSFVIPACAVDAQQERKRTFILARREPATAEDGPLADAGGSRSQRPGAPGNGGGTAANSHREASELGHVRQPRVRSPEPRVGRVADGVPHRLDRLQALGNAVVPALAEEIGRCIVAAEEAVL